MSELLAKLSAAKGAGAEQALVSTALLRGPALNIMADYYYEARKHDKWLRRHAKENKVSAIRDPDRMK